MFKAKQTCCYFLDKLVFQTKRFALFEHDFLIDQKMMFDFFHYSGFVFVFYYRYLMLKMNYVSGSCKLLRIRPFL